MIDSFLLLLQIISYKYRCLVVYCWLFLDIKLPSELFGSTYNEMTIATWLVFTVRQAYQLLFTAEYGIMRIYDLVWRGGYNPLTNQTTFVYWLNYELQLPIRIYPASHNTCHTWLIQYLVLVDRYVIYSVDRQQLVWMYLEPKKDQHDRQPPESGCNEKTIIQTQTAMWQSGCWSTCPYKLLHKETHW